MSMTRASAASDRAMPYLGYLPRLLEQPWDGARIVAGSVAFCEITSLTAHVEPGVSPVIDGMLDDLAEIGRASCRERV